MLFRVAPRNMLWTVPGDNTLFAPFDIAGGDYDFNYAGLKSVRPLKPCASAAACSSCLSARPVFLTPIVRSVVEPGDRSLQLWRGLPLHGGRQRDGGAHRLKFPLLSVELESDTRVEGRMAGRARSFAMNDTNILIKILIKSRCYRQKFPPIRPM